MIYNVTKWTIKDLVNTFKSGNLDLSPPYQRNFIWTTSDQQHLMDSIKKNNPIPNFFLLQREDKTYEMVDGQQRSRTIIGFLSGLFKDLEGNYYALKTHGKILDYDFPVTIITDTQGESIEKFYAMVNKTGIHVNKPEIRKADYYETNFLKLVEGINASDAFKQLAIFTANTMKRMNDVEFISELVVLIKQGHVDKKDLIDEYFRTDLTPEECEDIRNTFEKTLGKISELNKVFPINATRYKQRNDFYTLFDFILKHPKLQINSYRYFYKILVMIGTDIRPTQEKCQVLKDYAINCVTQSNSKAARINRLDFFEKLLANDSTAINDTQKQLLKFYKLKSKDVKAVEGLLEIDIDELIKVRPVDFAL